jgi:D-proline reductase (dithiol) PrdB
VGLVARVVEAAGIPTVVIASARDITESVKPPRAVFVDYPLGHQTGLPGDAESQRAVLRAAFDVLESAREPGRIVELPFRWPEEFDYRPYAPGAQPGSG